MNDHLRARTLAATSLDFELQPAGRADLDAHLRDCAACRHAAANLRADAERLRGLDFGVVPERVRGRVAAVAHPGIAARPSLVLLAAGLLLILATFAAALGAGALLGERRSVPTYVAPIHWQTQVVSLTADELRIETGGQRFVGAEPIAVSSDPGTLTYRTLELTWHENGREMRISIYFGGDATSWWVDEIRTYDGGQDADWLFFKAPQIRAPLGRPWIGNVDLVSVNSSKPGRGPGTLHIAGLQLATTPQLGPGDPGVAPAQPPPPGSTGGVAQPAQPSLPVDGSIEALSSRP